MLTGIFAMRPVSGSTNDPDGVNSAVRFTMLLRMCATCASLKSFGIAINTPPPSATPRAPA